MKASNFLGTGVLDKNALKVGKVVDMFVEPEKGLINSIIVSKGELGLRKEHFIIKTEEIESLGDYIILNIEKSQVEVVGEGSETV
jgi:sporulation protein YlmC with PRC-barrel domain